MYVIDQAAGYAVFANGGKRAQPYAAFEVRNSKGDVIYRRDRDAPEPEQVLSSRVVADMNFMLSKVIEEGTGKRAALEGIRSAGKTGTTNDYHDAWYIGFTGNLVAAVWYGNDDYSSTNKMTGGTLPAMTWHEVMAFAHQNTEIKPIPGLDAQGAPVVAAGQKGRRSRRRRGQRHQRGSRRPVAPLLRGHRRPWRSVPHRRAAGRSADRVLRARPRSGEHRPIRDAASGRPHRAAVKHASIRDNARWDAALDARRSRTRRQNRDPPHPVLDASRPLRADVGARARAGVRILGGRRRLSVWKHQGGTLDRMVAHRLP